MFEKNMKIAYLLDFYSETLDDHTKDIMRAYYNDDLSLAEIAEDEGISRQGIRHIIKKGEEQLEFLESRLCLAKKHDDFSSIKCKILDVISKLEETYASQECIDALKNISENLLKGI